MSWASPQDIQDRWVGTDVPQDEYLLTQLIQDAEAVILAEYPRIQARIDSAELPQTTVVMVISRMVSRVIRNPEALTYLQQTTGPFGQARNYGSAPQDIWLTDNEKSLLAPQTRGKAKEVNLGYNATDVYAADPIDPLWREVH